MGRLILNLITVYAIMWNMWIMLISFMFVNIISVEEVANFVSFQFYSKLEMVSRYANINSQ